MKIGEYWNKLKKNWILSAIITGVIGLILLLFPGQALLSVTYCIGGLSIAVGVIRTVRYFKQDHSYPFLFQSDLVTGLLAIGLGLFMVTQPKSVMTLLPHIFGILMIGCGVGNILRAVDAKKAGFRLWGWLLGLAIVSVILGWLVLGNPFGAAEVVVAVAGGCMVYESITDLITTFVLQKKLKILKQAQA